MSITSMFEFVKDTPSIQAGIWLLTCFAIFSILQEFFAHDKSQPKIRKDFYIDVIYWLATPLFVGAVSTAMIIAGFYIIFAGDTEAAIQYSKQGADWVMAMPFWAQLVAIMLIQDFSLYWTHRIFHGGNLWKYHSIHHGAQNLDWAHCVRFHPLNIICHTVFANALTLWMGFTPYSLAVLAPFNMLYSAMVHANLNWTFGPLKYVFASPIFHRWHHTSPEEGGNKNFAATFPILDVIFGTFYMPEGKLPGKTGLYEDYVPKTILGQLAFPFTKAARGDIEVAAE